MSQYTPKFSAGSDYSDSRIVIIRTEWNDHIVGALASSARQTLLDSGVKAANIVEVCVPGAVELTYAASRLADDGDNDAIIVLGCVIKGETPHFDYVCQSVTQGITQLNWDGIIPVIFGLLTVNDEQQALDRIKGGKVGDKGEEFARTALAMIDFDKKWS